MKFRVRDYFVWVSIAAVLCSVLLFVVAFNRLSGDLVTAQAELTSANRKLMEVNTKCLKKIHGKQIIEAFLAKVVDVIDGDSIRVVNDANAVIGIRLDSIDCPELEQAFGNEARSRLIDLVHGENVEVQITQRGQHQVTRAFVVVDSLDVSLTLVQEGLAWNEISYSRSEEFDKAQGNAKTDRLGLWQDQCPCSPWQFRLSSLDKVTGLNDFEKVSINIDMRDSMGLLEVGDVVDIYQKLFVRDGWDRNKIASAIEIATIDEIKNGSIRVSVVAPRNSVKEIQSVNKNGVLLRAVLIPIAQDD